MPSDEGNDCENHLSVRAERTDRGGSTVASSLRENNVSGMVLLNLPAMPLINRDGARYLAALFQSIRLHVDNKSEFPSFLA
jgi:hypothetical protein